MITKETVATVIDASFTALEHIASKTPWSFDDWVMQWLRKKQTWLVKVVWTMLAEAGEDAKPETLALIAPRVIAEKGPPPA